MLYEKGDVILVLFPYEEKNMTKKRPALVLDVHEGYYTICQITSRNKTGQSPGMWILKDSPLGRQMGIMTDSFINLGRTVKITEDFIDKKIGHYPDVDNLLKQFDL